jgi:sec-independent protein translocase protein TatA
LGTNELLIIAVLVLGVLFFGGKKLQEISKSAGRAVGEFKKGKLESEKELKELGKKNK